MHTTIPRPCSEENNGAHWEEDFACMTKGFVARCMAMLQEIISAMPWNGYCIMILRSIVSMYISERVAVSSDLFFHCRFQWPSSPSFFCWRAFHSANRANIAMQVLVITLQFWNHTDFILSLRGQLDPILPMYFWAWSGTLFSIVNDSSYLCISFFFFSVDCVL